MKPKAVATIFLAILSHSFFAISASNKQFSLVINYPEKTSLFEVHKQNPKANESLVLLIDGRRVKSRPLTSKDKTWLKNQVQQVNFSASNRIGKCRLGELVLKDDFSTQPRVFRTCIGAKDREHKKITTLINSLNIFL